jgi:hypothetical protein
VFEASPYPDPLRPPPRSGGRIYYVAPEETENKLTDLLDKDLREPIAFICSVFVASCFAFHGHSFIYAIILQDVFHEEVQAEYYALAYAALAQIGAVVLAAKVALRLSPRGGAPH